MVLFYLFVINATSNKIIIIIINKNVKSQIISVIFVDVVQLSEYTFTL